MNKKKTIITILIVCLIFFGIVLGKNCLSYKLPNSAMGVRSVVAKGNIDTLFIGSSGYRKGVDMQMLVNELPGESFMMTYNGNEPFNIYLELKELLKEDVKINRLIIDFNPSMMDRGADLSDKRLLWDVSMSTKIELWNELKKKSNTSFFDFYDYWVLSNNDYMATYVVSYPLISARYYYGGSTPADETKGKSAKELDEMPIVENPGIDKLEEESIINIIDLCNENNIDLVFLESPRYVTMEKDKNYKEKSKALCRIIEENGGKYILRTDLGFDNNNPNFYSDLTHMSGEGKREFTRKLIDCLKLRYDY